MQPLFTSILSRSDWLMVWDHFITNGPAFMYFFIVSYLKCHRVALLGISKIDDFEVSRGVFWNRGILGNSTRNMLLSAVLF